MIFSQKFKDREESAVQCKPGRLTPSFAVPTTVPLKDVMALASSLTMKKKEGLTFLIVVEEGGNYLGYLRTNQPCYGELRKYHARDPKGYTDPKMEDGESDDYFPSDLWSPFPEGTPVGLVVPVNPKMIDLKDFFFSETSPWRKGFGEVKIGSTGGSNYVEFHSTDFDPTVMVSLLNNMRSTPGSQLDGFFEASMLERFIIGSYLTVNSMSYDRTTRTYVKQDVPTFAKYDARGYYIPHDFDLDRFMSGDTLDVTGGTFRDRFDYNRKRLQDVFLNTAKDERYNNLVESFIGKPATRENVDQIMKAVREMAAKEDVDLTPLAA